jgi:TonB family protein
MSMTPLTMTTLLTVALLVLPSGASQGSEPDRVLRVYDRTTPGLVLPTVVKSGAPRYTAAAMHQRIRGIAVVDVTVGADGKILDVLLARSLDAVHGLDDEALAAAGRWVFSPGTLNGQPVPVRVQIDLAFAIKEGRSSPGVKRR